MSAPGSQAGSCDVLSPLAEGTGGTWSPPHPRPGGRGSFRSRETEGHVRGGPGGTQAPRRGPSSDPEEKLEQRMKAWGRGGDADRQRYQLPLQQPGKEVAAGRGEGDGNGMRELRGRGH